MTTKLERLQIRLVKALTKGDTMTVIKLVDRIVVETTKKPSKKKKETSNV